MERARKKTTKQDAVDAPGTEQVTTEASETVAPKRKSVATKKVAEPKMVEPAEPIVVEAAEPEVTPAIPKVAPRRGRPVKAKVAPEPKAPARAPRATASTKAKPAPSKMPKTSRPKATMAKVKEPTPKAAKPATIKAAPRAATAKPVASRGVEPLEASAEIKLGFLAESVGFHLRLAQDASYRAFARHRDKDLIKPGRLPALAIIHLNPGISQSALGRAIARDKSTVSPLIKDLQKNGFISRKASTADRRSVTLALTKKGERTLDRLQSRAQEHENEVDKIIGTSKGRLLSLLDKITTGMAL